MSKTTEKLQNLFFSKEVKETLNSLGFSHVRIVSKTKALLIGKNGRKTNLRISHFAIDSSVNAILNYAKKKSDLFATKTKPTIDELCTQFTINRIKQEKGPSFTLFA